MLVPQAEGARVLSAKADPRTPTPQLQLMGCSVEPQSSYELPRVFGNRGVGSHNDKWWCSAHGAGRGSEGWCG